MLRSPDTVLKYLPLFSLGGIVLSIFYVSGYFSFASDYWLTSLSISDYIALCIPALPGLLMGALVGVASWENPIIRKMRQANRLEERQKKGTKASLEQRPSARGQWTAFAGVILVYEIYARVRDGISPSTAYWSLALAIAATTVLAAWFFMFAVFRDWGLGFAALVAFGIASITYSSGQIQGALALTRVPDTVVELASGETHCAAVIMLMDRGPLYSSDARTVRLESWSNVNSITRGRSCRQGD